MNNVNRTIVELAAPKDSENVTPLLLSTIESLPNDTTLVLQKGTYHLYEEGTKTIWLNVSNNRSCDKYVAMPIFNKKGIVIEGNGSKIVCHGLVFPFATVKSEDVIIRNLTITTEYPYSVGFTIESKDDDGFTIKFDDGICPYVVKDGNIDFMLDGNVISSRDGRVSLHSMDRIHVVYLMTPNAPGDKSKFPARFMGINATDLGNGRVYFKYYGDDHPKSAKCPFEIGEYIAINMEEKRRRCAFLFDDCLNVKLENVAIERFGGMAFIAQRSGNITIDHFKVRPREGERVSVTADIMQLVNCYGKVSIIDSECGSSMDDVINIHGNYLEVVEISGKRARLDVRHSSHAGFFPYREGDVVEFSEKHTRRILATARVVSVTPDPDNISQCILEVDSNIEELPIGSLLENTTLNPDVEILRNKFSDFPHIRLSGRGKYLVEDNEISQCSLAINISDLADYWYESGRVKDMTIRNNLFCNCNALGGNTFISIGVSGWPENAPLIHEKIILENNRFVGVKDCRVKVNGVINFIHDHTEG